MLKSTFRYILLFSFAALVSAASASGAYIVTKNILNQDAANAASDTVEAVRAETPSHKTVSTAEFESYIVRLEDNEICVYALSNKSEEFLYSTNIYRPNLSPEDIRMLSSGVTLDTSSELTGFMENYTS